MSPIFWYRDKGNGHLTFIDGEPLPSIDGSGWTPLYGADAIAELEPKAKAFDAIVKHKLSVEYWDNGEWSTCTPLRAPNFYNADLLLAVQEVVGKIEGKK